MTIDLDELERLALAATPGIRAWRFVGNIPGDGCYRLDVVDEEGDHVPEQRPILITDRSDKALGFDPLPSAADAAFIAAANPAAVLELVRRLRAAKALTVALSEWAERARQLAVAAIKTDAILDPHEINVALSPWEADKIKRRAVEEMK